MSRRLLAVLVSTALLGALGLPAGAEFPQKSPPDYASDPYAYENYMFLPAANYPPNDITSGKKEWWVYSSKTACELYPPPHSKAVNCNPALNANPQELFGVTGASIDRAWETTTGRPDVVIAVTDSGIKWNDTGAMSDLANKTWLNKGELPEPDWGVRDPAHPYDRNFDGVFNIKDYFADSRVSDLNGNGIIDPEDLIFRFSDGIDTDANGYTDDFVGWDALEDDNDPFDEVQFGHGTGEARDSTAEMNNGGSVGVCPNCMVMHMRVGDSFIADVNDFAEGLLYAADNGASLIQSALGTLNNTRFAQEAINYAYRRGVTLIASAADESAGHHNQPSVLEHAVTVNNIGEPQTPGSIPSYLQFRGCTNFGAYITAAAPGNSCSSEATGRTSGMTGLVYSAARNAVAKSLIGDYGALDGAGGVPAGRALSAEEVDQIISTTADDLNFVTPVNMEARPDIAAESQRYPATEGWDPFFGYGRTNAHRMVQAVSQNKIPPEADITSPVWFATIDPNSGPIRIEGTVAARRAAKYSYGVKWAVWSWRDSNAAPAYRTDFVTLTSPGDQTAPISGLLATIDPLAVRRVMTLANGGVGSVDGPAVDPATGRGDHENRQIPDKFGVIVQLEVTAKDALGVPLTNIDGKPLKGIGTKDFDFHGDPALFPGFPMDLKGDGEAPPRFADLDNDGDDELIVGTANGEIHAFRHGGGELPGWPVHTSDMQLNYAAPAYSSGEITTPVFAAMIRSPAVGDLNRDGELEVVASDFMGRVSAFDRGGSVLPGFPVRTNPNYSAVQRLDRETGYYAAHPELSPGRYPGPLPLPNSPDIVPDLVNRKTKLNRTAWWIAVAPTLANIDPSDDDLEIIAGSADRHLYAWNSNGSPVPGWPVMLRDPAMLGSTNPATHEITNAAGIKEFNGAKIVTSPAVGDIDGDGISEVVATVNEQYLETPNTDEPLPAALLAIGEDAGNNRLYAIFPDGSLHGGGPGSPANGHPNANAFLPGWPARIASAVLELLPVVGNGPDGSPVLGNVNGGSDLEIGIFGTTGPAYILGPNGSSIYGKDAQGRDLTLSMEAVGSDTNSPDAPTIPAVAGGIFTAFSGKGLSFAVPATGIGKLLDVVLPEDQIVSDNHLSVWELSGSRAQLPAFPREVNDLQFLSTPASADVDGDGLEELLVGTAYDDVHAFNVLGAEPGLKTLSPTGWPKFTGGWTVGPPAVGDFDGDGLRDIAHSIREGRLYVWHGNGAKTCDKASWPEFGHDGWNTNNIETDAVRPAAVRDLSVAYSADGASVTLSWTAPGDDGICGTAHSYDVRSSASSITSSTFAGAAPIAGAPAPAPPGTTQSFTFPRLASDNYVALRTFDADPATDTPAHPANPSAISNVLFVRGLIPPSAPTNLTATAGDSKVRLSWTAPADIDLPPVTSYKVYRGTTPGGEALLAAIGNVTSYTDTTVVNGTTYLYQVSAVNLAGEGALSTEVSATPAAILPPPTPTIASPVEGSLNPKVVTVSGNATPGVTVKVYDGGVLRGTPVAGSTGAWTVRITMGEGFHTITATAIAGGPESAPSSPRTFDVDAGIPALTITPLFLGGFLLPGGRIEGTASDNRGVRWVVLVYRDRSGKVVLAKTATCDGCPGTPVTWSDDPDLSPGFHTVVATVFDPAGNRRDSVPRGFINTL